MASIYEQIKAAIGPDGALPKDFPLETAEAPKGITLEEGPMAGKKILYAKGAGDGINAYHGGWGPDEEMLEKLKEVTRLAAAPGGVEAGAYKAANDRLYDCFREGEDVLSCYDFLQEWVVEHQKELDIELLLCFTGALLKESASIGAVKYALTILTLMPWAEGEWRDRVRVLALCDEFTLFCVRVAARWDNPNEELFAMAQKVKGWGRVHAVEALEPTTQEMRDWLLDEGWDNDVMAEYTAWKCAEAGGLSERLSRDMTPEQLESANSLLKAMMNRYGSLGGGLGIVCDKMMLDWLGHLETAELDLQLVEMISQVWETGSEYEHEIDYERDLEEEPCENKWGQVKAAAERLLTSETGRAVLQQAMEEGRNFSLGRKLGLDWQEALLTAAERNIGSWDHRGAVGWVDYCEELERLFDEGEPWTGRVISLWEKGLPAQIEAKRHWLDRLNDDYLRWLDNVDYAYSPVCSMVSRLASYPGRGLSLVLRLLEIPTDKCREAAMKVLVRWREQGWVWTGEAAQAVARRLAADKAAEKEKGRADE